MKSFAREILPNTEKLETISMCVCVWKRVSNEVENTQKEKEKSRFGLAFPGKRTHSADRQCIRRKVVNGDAKTETKERKRRKIKSRKRMNMNTGNM